MSRLRKAALSTVLALLAVLVPGMGPALALSERNERVYVANSGSDTVSVIDADTNAVIATIPVGDRPTGVLAVGSRVYVTNQLSGTVSVIDVATNAVVATVPVGARPSDLAVDPSGRQVWVANEGSDTVSVIDRATNAVVATVPVGVAPRGISFSHNHVYVTSQSDTVTVIDRHTFAVVATVPVGHTPADIAALVLTPKVYVTNQSSNTVSVISSTSNTVTKTIAVGVDPTGIVAHLRTNRIFVANKGSNTISVIDMATETVVDTWPAVHPHGLALSVLGYDRLYATGMGTHGVVTVLESNTGAVLATVPVGEFPEGIAVAAVPPPVIAGQTWYSSGAKAGSGPPGTTVSLYAAGALEGVPYQLTLSRPSDWPCLHRVAILNPATVVAGPNGLIGRVRGTIPPGTPAGNYTICFRHPGGLTATGPVTFTVT